MGEPIKQIKGKVHVPYEWSYGGALTKFFQIMRDEKKIMGARCKNCGKVLVPPTKVCGKCYSDTDEDWVEVSDHGELLNFTVVYLPFPGQPTKPPYAYGYIRLDGSATTYPHMISNIDFDQIKVGMRLKAIWNEERKGNLHDIKYFEPE